MNYRLPTKVRIRRIGVNRETLPLSARFLEEQNEEIGAKNILKLFNIKKKV